MVYANVETITPAKAADMLRHNPKNRKVVPARVGILIRALKEGQWVLNGESIKIAEGGRLLDGQHRLAAIVQSGIPAPVIVVRGLPDSDTVIETIDVGKPRSFADYLRMNGVPGPYSVAATTAILLKWEMTGIPDRTGGDFRPTIPELAQYFEARPAIRMAVLKGDPFRRTYPGGSAWAACWFRTHEVSPADSAVFWDAVQTGANLPAGSPILALRRWMVLSQSTANVANSIPVFCAVIIKAWNAWRTGKTARILVWKGAEPFPEVK